MDKEFCRKIDNEFLIEQYVKGGLPPDLRLRIENHIRECPVHAQALRLERLLNYGIKEYARNQVKQRLKSGLRKTENTKVLILRFAAILFVAIFIPVLLYYSLYMDRSEQPLAEKEFSVPPAAVSTSDIPEETRSMKPVSAMPRAAGSRKQSPYGGEILRINPDSLRSVEIIRHTILDNRERLNQCIPGQRANTENLAFELFVNPDGKIKRISYSEAIEADLKIKTCLDSALNNLHFDLTGQDVRIYFRFRSVSAETGGLKPDTDIP